MRPIIEALVVPPFAENTYLVGDADAGEAIAVDPGGRIDELLALAEAHGLVIREIVATHAHVDHVSGVAELARRTGAPFRLHPDAAPALAGLPAQAALYGLGPTEVPAVAGALLPGDELAVGALSFDVRFTPGHALGHVTLVSRSPLDVSVSAATAGAGGPRGLALCGDVIFAGSVGRVDLPGGDGRLLMASIEREILSLPDDTLLLSGHGPATTVGRERATNPFVLAHLRGEALL